MGVRIIQVDLAQPLPTLQLGVDRRDHAPLWILVKLGPQPVGWVRCGEVITLGKQIGPDQLLKLCNDALSRPIQAAARERAHEPIALTRTPSFSIVICTGDGCDPAALANQLRSIAKLHYPQPNYEVIVVDQRAAASMRGVCETFPLVRYAHDPRPGLNYARNTGWQLGRCELVAYLEPGSLVDADWLLALAANYGDAQVDCVTGVALPREIETPVQEQFELHLEAHRKFRRRTYRPGTWNGNFPLDATRFGSGANLSLSRNTLEAIGGFDVALNADGGVLDAFTRVLREGGAIVHDPRAIVFAAYPRTSRQLRQALSDAACGFTSFCTKHVYDLELGNHSMPLLARWFASRLRTAIRSRDLPRDIAWAELVGGASGMRAYRRAVRRVRKDQATFAKRGMTPTEVPLRKALRAPETPPAPQTPPAPARARTRARGRKAAA